MNKNVLIGLGLVAAGVFIIEPRWLVAAAPLLLFLACPLSMLVMMRGMGGSKACASSGGEQGERGKRADRADTIGEVARLRAEIAELRAALGDHARPHSETQPPASATAGAHLAGHCRGDAAHLLARRFAAGEIDEEGYRHRLGIPHAGGEEREPWPWGTAR